MSSVNTAREALERSWRTLRQQWGTTCDLWKDPVQRHFEREFWEQWEQVVPATTEAMRDLAEVLSAARRAVR
jgi:hypothetical protein